MKLNGFTGTGTLLQLFLRRDRFLLPLWIFLPVVLAMTVAATFTAMADQGMHSILNEFDKDPLVSAILGPVMSFELSGAIVWRGASQLEFTIICRCRSYTCNCFLCTFHPKRSRGRCSSGPARPF